VSLTHQVRLEFGDAAQDALVRGLSQCTWVVTSRPPARNSSASPRAASPLRNEFLPQPAQLVCRRTAAPSARIEVAGERSSRAAQSGQSAAFAAPDLHVRLWDRLQPGFDRALHEMPPRG